MLERTHLVFLKRESSAGTGTAAAADDRALWSAGPGDTARVASLTAALDRRVNEARIAQRLRLGVRYFALLDGPGQDARPVAATWCVTGARYLDEFALRVPLDAGQWWVRDAWVAPHRRGQRLFTRLVDAVSRALVRQQPVVCWSDVDADNLASLRAHEAAGFARVGEASSWFVGDRLCLRSRLPALLAHAVDLRARRRWLWLSASERERHAAWIA